MLSIRRCSVTRRLASAIAAEGILNDSEPLGSGILLSGRRYFQSAIVEVQAHVRTVIPYVANYFVGLIFVGNARPRKFLRLRYFTHLHAVNHLITNDIWALSDFDSTSWKNSHLIKIVFFGIARKIRGRGLVVGPPRSGSMEAVAAPSESADTGFPAAPDACFMQIPASESLFFHYTHRKSKFRPDLDKRPRTCAC